MSDRKEKEIAEKDPGRLANEGWDVGSGPVEVEDRRLKKRSRDRKGDAPKRGTTFSIDITPSEK